VTVVRPDLTEFHADGPLQLTPAGLEHLFQLCVSRVSHDVAPITGVIDQRSCADRQRYSPVPGERRVDNGMHLLQQRVDSVVLSVRDGNLDGIE
jgi:hypothetical protein